MNARYTGICSACGNAILVERNRDIENLGTYRAVRDHSPDFSWGYGGSGPAQTALAILCDHFTCSHAMRPELAWAAAEILYRHFEFHTIEKLPHHKPFQLTSDSIDAALRDILASCVKLKENAGSLISERLASRTLHNAGRAAGKPVPAWGEAITLLERESQCFLQYLGV